jgi:colicin import membrane protein
VSAVTSKPGAPYQVPPEPNRWPSIAMAAGVHAALLAFLWIGVSWQNTEPVSVEAEVWDMKTEAAAPPPPPAPPEEVAPAPLPAPRVAPPPPPPVEQKITPKPPDIALEREKQRKLQREEERKERVERELAEREERKREDLAEKKAREKADKLAEKKERDAAEKLAQKKAQEAERKARELADKQAEKKEAEKLAAADKKKAADKLAKAKAAADDKQMKALRDAEMARITGAGTNGTAAKSTAPRSDPGYVASITSAIKSRSSYAGDTDMPGNPKVVFRVEQLPTGEIISVRKTKSSGIPEFDRAVENAINKSSPLPKKKDGTVERSLEVGFSMKDLN